MTMAPLRKVNFDANVFLLSKARDRELRSRPAEEKVEHVGDTQKQEDMRPPLPEEVTESKKESAPETVTSYDPERTVGASEVTVDTRAAGAFEVELRQILKDLGLAVKLRLKRKTGSG